MTILSCSKKDDNSGHSPCSGNEATTYITSPDLQNCKYKTESYWVFVDSVNNSFDSISVESFNQGFLDDICGNSHEIHSFKTISSSSMESTDYVVVAGGLFKDFTGSPNSGTQIYDDFNTTTSMSNYIIGHLDSIFIYDRYYKNVLQVEIENDPTEDHNKSFYFINSEFGFLRHDIYSSNTLVSKKVLMRKNIIR
jgi:hypothetical protein